LVSGDVDSFIARWQGNEGGQERANYALFLTELCTLLDLPQPQPASAAHEHNDYVFERVVRRHDGGEKVGHGRIDLYKRGCFVLEAKQSRWQGEKQAAAGQGDIFAADEPRQRGRRSIDRNWDVLMINARRQAEDYARALPEDHDWPPFVIVCDVGHAFEIYADFTGKGRNYSQFPDRKGYRIYLEDLREEKVRERLRLIWTEPHALDPARQAAEATRDVARRLAEVSKLLEGRGFAAEEVAHFLMRCLFTMFAEDVKLLPEASFTDLLKRCVDDPSRFQPMVGQLWAAMNSGDFAYAIEAKVKHFNGEFFKSTKVLPLNREEIGELLAASARDWRNVEPAIFGTLLEGALDKTERSKLGAHYTPRAYVERLVVPTIMEPLREDWSNALAAAEKLREAGEVEKAIAEIHRFHEQLCATRVLDPACGTGNFLYVSMELMKRLEGEVLDALAGLGGQEALAFEEQSVDPHQLLGIEVNPRAAAIAELVLWIGYLQLHYRQSSEHPSEPILRAFHNIENRDAVLTWDGYPLPKVADGKETYPGARQPDWPMAEFIVGNPPFVGGKDIRSRTGDGYTEAVWAAHPKVNNSADFVMYWWERAATLLTAKGTLLRRFGLVTTNSITQVFQRRVVERHLSAQKPISLLMAIPDHPWTKETKDAAAVRIAMTVAAAGEHEGTLLTVVREAGLASDQPVIELSARNGKINADLSVGVDLQSARELNANQGLCYRGVQLMGGGFIVEPAMLGLLGYDTRAGLKDYIKPYRNGRDLTAHPRGVMVIDLFGLGADEVRQRFPEVYQHLIAEVKEKRGDKGELVGRDWNNRETYRKNWWVFGEPRADLRPALNKLSRYIVTVETMKHRVFQFLDRDVLPDNRLVVVSLEDSFFLGVLSSRVHVAWTLENGGTLEDRPIYTKSVCFDPFPFPDPVPETLRQELREAAEELDATRKAVLAAHPDLTLTGLYNVLEKLRADPAHKGEGEGELTAEELDIRDRGRVLILKDLHETIDRLTFRAYGWPESLSDEEILERLVALNRQRAAEEAAGHVRWLRPAYQIARFGAPTEKKAQIEATLVAPEDKGKPSFPQEEARRAMAISSVLAVAAAPLSAAEIAARFRQGKRVERDIALTLRAFARLGDVSTADGGKTFALRRVA
jgi:hypothetical protein